MVTQDGTPAAEKGSTSSDRPVGETTIPVAAPRVRRTLILNLALLAFSIFGAMGAGELALRLAGHHLLPGGQLITAGKIVARHDVPLGYSLEPRSSQIAVMGGAYTKRYAINSIGQRDVEHTFSRPSGVPRLLVMGDSFMFGYGVEMEESLSRQLGRQMTGVEVINAGVLGYDLGQEYLYYKDRGHRFGADVVVLAFFINDLACSPEIEAVLDSRGLPVLYKEKPFLLDRERREAETGVMGWISARLRAHSLLYVLLRKRMGEWGSTRKDGGRPSSAGVLEYFTAFRTRPDGGTSAEWSRAFVILDDLNREVESHGARLVVLMVPAPFQMSAQAWDEWVAWWKVDGATVSRLKPQEMLRAWSARSGAASLDLLPGFQMRDRADLFQAYDLHWTAEGHRLAAGLLREYLDGQGLLVGR